MSEENLSASHRAPLAVQHSSEGGLSEPWGVCGDGGHLKAGPTSIPLALWIPNNLQC